ncbi:hypothetical protein BJV82DRAFT_636723, partial [Fennellomyces sp. T-0311]
MLLVLILCGVNDLVFNISKTLFFVFSGPSSCYLWMPMIDWPFQGVNGTCGHAFLRYHCLPLSVITYFFIPGSYML